MSQLVEPVQGVAEAAAATAGAASDAAAAVAREATVPEPVARRRRAADQVVAVLGLAGFVGVFALVRARRSEALDLAVTLKLQRQGNPVVDTVMRAASWPGFPPQSRVIPVAVVGALWAARLRTEAVCQLAGWGTGALSSGLKAIMKRPRPVAGTDLRVVAAPLGGSSFPSGHVITYMGTYGFSAYLAHTRLRDRAGRGPIVAALLALLALVGPSRIYQGHHWPTDVTASYLLGASYLVGLTTLYRWLKRDAAPR